MFSACETYEKQLGIEKTRLSHQVWSHGGSTFKKKRTLNGHFSRPAKTDIINKTWPQILISWHQFKTWPQNLISWHQFKTWPQKLIKWHQFKTWPQKLIKWHQKLIKWHQLLISWHQFISWHQKFIRYLKLGSTGLYWAVQSYI